MSIILTFTLPIYLYSTVYILNMGEGSGFKQAAVAVQFDMKYVIIGLYSIVALAMGAYMARFRTFKINQRQYVPFSRFRAAFDIILMLSLIGYAFFFIGTLKGGVGLLLEVLKGNFRATYAIKSQGVLYPGISSMTQCAPAYLVALLTVGPRPSLRSAYWRWGAVLLALAFVRSVIWSERLALIEIVVPSFCAYALRYGIRGRNLLSQALRYLGPAVIILLAVIMFALFEYTRSWEHYRQAYDGNIILFALDRLSLYYGTALSNGRILVEYVPREFSRLNFTLEMIYKMPLLSAFDISRNYNSMQYSFISYLKGRGDIEFNNPSGIFSYVYDWGLVLCVPFFVTYGFIVQRLYEAAVRGALFGKLFFPFAFLALLEFLRVPYLTAPRCFYTYGSLLFFVAISSRGLISARPRAVAVSRSDAAAVASDS